MVAQDGSPRRAAGGDVSISRTQQAGDIEAREDRWKCPVGMAGLCPGPGIFVRLVKFGLNPAFAVLFLRSQNLPHQGGLARLVLYVRILAWLLAGAAAWRLF